MSTAGARRKRAVRSSKNGAGAAIAEPVEDAQLAGPPPDEAALTVVGAESEPPAESPEAAGFTPGEAGASGAVPIAAELDRARQRAIVESLIFVSERTVTAAQIARSVKIRAALVRELVAEVMDEYRGRGIELIEVAGGYQFRSAPACAPFVREFVAQRPVRLTRAQLETLALIAYRQPITRPEIDEVRGVDSGSAMRVLLERGLIKMLGRKDEPGRPLLYGTSTQFLEFFGMRSLKDLPTLREFTELSDENRALFKRKIGDAVEDAEAELLAAEEALRAEEQAEHVSDEDLAELAREADAEDAAKTPSAAPPEDVRHDSHENDGGDEDEDGEDDGDDEDEDEDDEDDDEAADAR